MSIATKTGDDGTTGLMYGRRVPKNHPRDGVSPSFCTHRHTVGLIALP